MLSDHRHLHKSLQSNKSTASKFWIFWVRATFSCTSDFRVRPSMYPSFGALWHFWQFTLRVTNFSRDSGFDRRILYSPTSRKDISMMYPFWFLSWRIRAPLGPYISDQVVSSYLEVDFVEIVVFSGHKIPHYSSRLVSQDQAHLKLELL
jgi:hypothetical protein